MRTILIAAALSVTPVLAFAMGCSGYHTTDKETVASCPAGQTWDGETSSCVDQATS